METFKKIFYHYFVGVLISASIVFLIILFYYFVNGYLLYPELSNLIKVSLISGVGFGMTHFASLEIKNSKNKKNN